MNSNLDFGLFDKTIMNNEFEEAIQELDILFGTNNTELIGDVQFGVNFEQFLWNLIPSTDAIEKYIKNKIQTNTFYLRSMNYDVSVEYIDDINGNMYVAHITIYKNDDSTVERVYNIN